jgi:DNA repair photolyase
MSSATDPWVPQEREWRITRGLLEAMLEEPPDRLILQTHSHRVLDDLELLPSLAARTELRLHLSIESDRDRLPGLPAPASSVEERFAAAAALRRAGLFVVITVAPLLPIEQPAAFFERIAAVAEACVLDHFIDGDGSEGGARTRRTGLPAAIALVDPEALQLAYRDRMVEVARRHLPGRVGVHVDGFAGRWLPP